MLRPTLMAACAAAAIAPALPAGAQDAYVVGVSGALTGPSAGTNAPPIEGLRLYVDRLNAAGGVNGKKIQLTVLDDQGEPSKAAANTKRLLTQDNASLLILSSLSSTFAPVIAETKRANVALMRMRAVCPKEVYPPADLLQFCTTAYAGGYDSRATLAFIKETAKEPVRIGFAAMAIPLSRGEIDYAEEQAKTMGMTPVDKEVIPPPTADYTPFATKLKDANPNWIFSWAPWVTQVKTFEALRRLGWEGDYITWAHIEAEAELARLKDGKFYVIGANSLFPGQLADPQTDRGRGQESKRAIPGRADDRGLDRRTGARGRAQRCGLAGRCRKNPRRDGEREGRHARPARRADRMEQGQPLPPAPILSRLSLGPCEIDGHRDQGLGGLRREVTGMGAGHPGTRAYTCLRCPPRNDRESVSRCCSSSTSPCSRRSTRCSPAATCSSIV